MISCKACQETSLKWGWNFATRRSVLLNEQGQLHRCPTPLVQDIFPGWCKTCKAPDLLWLRKQNGFELTESYGLLHMCGEDSCETIDDLKKAKCKHCSASDLFWVKANSKYTLTRTDGTKHTCPTYAPYMKDWAEAKRMDYAFQKAWLKSIPDGTKCKKCKGRGFTSFLSKNKKLLKKHNSTEPIVVARPCRHCKRMGVFTVSLKQDYLKGLRQKYWPFRGGVHKWKAYDTGML